MKINADELIRVAHNIDEVATSIQKSAVSLRQIENNVSMGWKSQYSQIYINDLREVQESADVLSKSMAELSRAMQKLAEKTKIAESVNAKLFLNK